MHRPGDLPGRTHILAEVYRKDYDLRVKTMR